MNEQVNESTEENFESDCGVYEQRKHQVYPLVSVLLDVNATYSRVNTVTTKNKR